MKFQVVLSLIFLLVSCAVDKTTELNFLAGTWKRENKELYEVWEQNKTNELIWYSYVVHGNQKSITETLIIRRVNDHFVYEATVPDQNEGRTIQFKLNTEIDSLFSFENYNHDFPKKIQYQKIDDNQIKVNVLGDDDDGFSYIQIRQ